VPTFCGSALIIGSSNDVVSLGNDALKRSDTSEDFIAEGKPVIRGDRFESKPLGSPAYRTGSSQRACCDFFRCSQKLFSVAYERTTLVENKTIESAVLKNLGEIFFIAVLQISNVFMKFKSARFDENKANSLLRSCKAFVKNRTNNLLRNSSRATLSMRTAAMPSSAATARVLEASDTTTPR